MNVPVVEPAGITTTIDVEVEEVTLQATPFNVTAFGLNKPVPLIVTLEPGKPLVGLKLVIVGAGCVTIKLDILDENAPEVVLVTRIVPVVVPPAIVIVALVAVGVPVIV